MRLVLPRLSVLLMILTATSGFLLKRTSHRVLQRFARKAPTHRMMSSSSSSITEGLLKVPTIPMRDGTPHPAIGFGTYKVGVIPASASAAVAGDSSSQDQRSAKDCVADALKAGYRFLECAEFYANEAEVGKAIAESGISRKDLFLCSKVWTTTIEKGPDAIRQQLMNTLAALQTDYIDLYLIHWPVPGHHVDGYKTLIQLKKEGLIKGVGVSNYAWEDYLELKEVVAQEDLPLVNQIEINPFLYRANTIQKFEADGVVMQSYRSLRDGKAMDDPTLKAIAAEYPGRTVAQILGRWCVQKGFVYMPKSIKPQRMLENANVLDFELSEEHMKTLDALTTPENLETFFKLYQKCVNRDTSKDGTMDGVKTTITVD